MLLNQTDYDNITLTCSYTMPTEITGFLWKIGNVSRAYWSGNCTPAGTEQLSGYLVRCEGKKMTMIVEPTAITDSLKEWTCNVGEINGSVIDSHRLELNGMYIVS